MARQCECVRQEAQLGNQVTTRGKQKYLGGVGTKVTGISRRQFKPNLQRVKVSTPNGTTRRCSSARSASAAARSRRSSGRRRSRCRTNRRRRRRSYSRPIWVGTSSSRSLMPGQDGRAILL